MWILREKSKQLLKNRAFYNIAFIVFFLIVSFLVFNQYYSFALSNTPSMDTFLFLNEKYTVSSPIIKDGRAVVFQAPNRFYKWKKYYKANGLNYPEKLSLVKYVACISGQVLNTVNRKDYCNGKQISEIPEYALLVPQPHMKIKGFPVWHNYKIPAGYFFATSPDKYGLDSRYFGLVRDSMVKYNTLPLFPKSVIK
ncbi:MAG: S26 family signal peptidase [bacterium]